MYLPTFIIKGVEEILHLLMLNKLFSNPLGLAGKCSVTKLKSSFFFFFELMKS